MNDVILETRSLAIGYRHGRKQTHRVCEQIDVRLFRGELTCLLGPNGVGKSTLIRTLIGLQPPIDGTIALNGRPLTDFHPHELARRIGVVLTERIQTGMLTAYALVGLGRYPYTSWAGGLSPADEQVIRWALTAVGAAPLAGRLVDELSDGERQKVMVARALAQEPDLIILDEPTAYLDLPHRVEIMRILRDLARRENRAILLSTHDLDLALRTADKLWLLAAGGRPQVGAPEDLVLSGAFQETFRGHGVEFDPMRGAFRTASAASGEIDLIGDGLKAVWTERALERAGYDVHAGANGATIRIEVVDGRLPGEAGASWRLTVGRQTSQIDSLAGLLEAIRQTQPS